MEKFKSGVLLCLLLSTNVMSLVRASTYNYTSSNGVMQNYGDALTKCILFFEGQRSGKLPTSQRMKWRGDSGLRDGSDVGVDLTGGYHDAGDNVKFNFPMAFTTTILAWSVLEFGKFMGPDLQHAVDAVRWGTDYFLKASSRPGMVYAGVGDPVSDHACWERAEDMDTVRTSYVVTQRKPGSEVSGEIAAALAAASLVFKGSDPKYSKLLLDRAAMVFQFADKYRGDYRHSLGSAVCPFYCGNNGYQDELAWAAIWLYKATNSINYWNYVKSDTTILGYNFAEFSWDAKYAGINVLASKLATSDAGLFTPNANKFVCSILPESPSKIVEYTPGGLLFSKVGTNLQSAASTSFLMIVYGLYLAHAKTTISCGNVVVNAGRLLRYANSQVDYILGANPMKMSYMVGYGNKFPQYIHHRGSSLPSVASHPAHIKCRGGDPFFASKKPNPNLLIGAVVGGPNVNDIYTDSRVMFNESEPTTYINAPLVGVLAFFKSNSKVDVIG